MSETIDIKNNDSGNDPNFIILKFADSKIPTFRELRGKDYIKYGDDNLYPEYLTFLFNKSAKHNAIITGKANYIFGKGYENGDVIINRTGETLNDISKKAILDCRIYGGFRLEIIWNRGRQISEMYHVDYSTLRKGKDGGFYYKERWQIDCRDQEEFIPSFDPTQPFANQIYEYNEYRPGIRFYPLPDYIGCLNYVETDIEISKFHLSAIRNGMAPSKMIQFFNGVPPDEKKREIESRLKKKYSGAENAGNFFLVFNESQTSKSVEVNDLSASELDKQMDILNKTTQQEIFSGHLVTSPMLFGIKTEGQLGGSTELKIAYSIFQNTYAEAKANDFDKEINYLLGFSIYKSVYKLQPTDPVGLQFDVKDVIQQLPKQFVFKELGIPEEDWNAPALTPQASNAGAGMSDSAPVNDHIKNLTGRQMQAINRIVRQYNDGNGSLKRAAAVAMLKTGYGLSDEDVVAFLGEEPVVQQLSFSENEDLIIGMFDECGESKNDFEVLKSKKVFSLEDTEDDETIYVKEAFKTYDVTATENKIIELIKKDERITPEVIAKTIGETVSYVESKIKSLSKRGYIESSTETIGTDEIIKRNIPKGLDITTPPPTGKINPTQIFIKYSYEGPQDNRNRPFCAKMMQLNRLYSRAEIEKISQRLGYSVFDRGGGFWRKPDGTTSPSCRHTWKSNIVIKKGGNDVA